MAPVPDPEVERRLREEAHRRIVEAVKKKVLGAEAVKDVRVVAEYHESEPDVDIYIVRAVVTADEADSIVFLLVIDDEYEGMRIREVERYFIPRRQGE